MKRFFVYAFLLLTNLQPLAAKENKDIDYLGVAAVLIIDGNYSRAADALASVDLEDEDLDFARYYTLLGLVQLRQTKYADAIDSFHQAIEQGQEDPVIHAYIAQGWFALEDYAKAIESIDRVPNINLYPELYGLKSQAYWFMEDTGSAFDVLEQGLRLFPGKSTLLQLKIYYFIELDLNQAAMETSEVFLHVMGEDPEAYMTVAESFWSGGEFEKAVEIMEMAVLLFPRNLRIKMMLAQVYLDRGMALTAASIVEDVSAYDPAFTKDAANLYLEAGNLIKARYLSTLLSDPKEKVQVRFSILIAEERFEEALALKPRLERTGCLQEEGVVYALAYVYFRVQKYDESIGYLNQIAGSQYFRQATQLREAIEVMKAEPVLMF